MTKSFGPYTVTMREEPYEYGALLIYSVRDGDGNAPFFEPYLGTSAHGILVSPEGDFIHTHPSIAGDTITLHIDGTRDPLYRVFLQFQVQETIYTANFDWEPASHEHAPAE